MKVLKMNSYNKAPRSKSKNYLVPDKGLSYEEKINFLVSIANKLVTEDMPFIKKLEKIGDYRRTDNGSRL